MDPETLTKQVCDLSLKVGHFIRHEHSRFDVHTIQDKSLNNFVTEVDKSSERILVEGLKKLVPEAGFTAEEGTVDQKGSVYNWIIDPLDGTTNFIHSIPCYCTSIALMEYDRVILGVVYEINLDECFYAWKGSKAFLNGNEINVTATNRLKDSLLATGFPYHDYGKLDEYLEILKVFTQKTRGIRRLGSAAADLAYLACGRFDGFYEYGLSPWDVAAGAFIVQQAGGKITDFGNGNNFIFGKEIIASNAAMHKEFLDVIQLHWPNKTTT